MYKSRALILFLVLLAFAPLFFLSHQNKQTRRFELGSLDRDYLEDSGQFYRPGVMMDGPIRHEDGSVEVIEFYGRLTRTDATLRLPYHAERSPIRLRIRCHRFGLEGTVALYVNGTHLQDFVFATSSYPWGGIEAVLPQSVAEAGPIHLRLVTRDGNEPPDHLPRDLGVGIDWVELTPMSLGARWLPLSTQWLSFYAFVLLGAGFMGLTGATYRTSVFTMVAMAAFTFALSYLYPVAFGLALPKAWIVFPLGALVLMSLRWARAKRVVTSLTLPEASFTSRLFVAAVVAHSALIFYPNHAPPDVPLHGIQVTWLEQLDVTIDDLRLYSQLVSRGITEDAVMMGIGQDASIEDLREHFAAGGSGTYSTPYPPFFYLSTYALSRPWDDIRFMLEFFPVLLAAAIVVLVYLIAKAIWNDVILARVASLLMTLEISLWHHVHRGHGPGIFGALFFVGFVWFLATHRETLATRKGMALFTVLSMVCMLCYTVTLVQLAIFMTLFLTLLMVSGGETRALGFRLATGFALGGIGALALFYGPYVASALSGGGVLLDRAEAYDPPARFYFLRNQLRDSVRFLGNGYPAYVLLSISGFFLLARNGTQRADRLLLWAGLASYGTLLVLKDPLMMPRVFLHAKEHLFYAPFACLVGALPLASLWKTHRWRAVVVAVFIGLAALAARDQAWNANTLVRQPLANLNEPERIRTA